jgi:hypothetical protein
MGLQIDECDPNEELRYAFPRSHIGSDRFVTVFKELADGLFERTAHQTITRDTARNLVFAIMVECPVGQRDLLVVQTRPAQYPIGDDVLIVEGSFVASLATDDAAVSLDNIVDESFD